jgi:hypothetical protein
MDESQSILSKPTLPPKRKPAVGESANVEAAESFAPPPTVEQANNEEVNLSVEENEIDPELLVAYEQSVKEIGTEVVVDITVPSRESTVTAPVLEDYIDPHTVPMQYLLEQARAQVKPDEMPQDSISVELDTNTDEKKS